MSLLDFARGPALEWSLIIFVIGVVWRLAGTFLFKGQKYLSKPKGTKGMWFSPSLCPLSQTSAVG